MGPGMGSIVGPVCCTTWRPRYWTHERCARKTQNRTSWYIKLQPNTGWEMVLFLILVVHFNFEFRPRFCTYESKNRAPFLKPTAYIYIYTYIHTYIHTCPRVLNWTPVLAVQGCIIEPFLVPSGNTTKIGVSRPRISTKKRNRIFENETSQVFCFSIKWGFSGRSLVSTWKHYFLVVWELPIENPRQI